MPAAAAAAASLLPKLPAAAAAAASPSSFLADFDSGLMPAQASCMKAMDPCILLGLGRHVEYQVPLHKPSARSRSTHASCWTSGIMLNIGHCSMQTCWCEVVGSILEFQHMNQRHICHLPAHLQLQTTNLIMTASSTSILSECCGRRALREFLRTHACCLSRFFCMGRCG